MQQPVREFVSADCPKWLQFPGNNQILLYRYKSNWQKALKGIKRGSVGGEVGRDKMQKSNYQDLRNRRHQRAINQ